MSTVKNTNRNWNIAIWAAQGLLSAIFGMAGFMKTTAPLGELTTSISWVADFPDVMVRFVGISELLAAIGLILPSLLRILPRLTIFAAIGLLIIMVLAMVYHIAKGEYSYLGLNMALGAIATFVAWGRMKKVPVISKA